MIEENIVWNKFSKDKELYTKEVHLFCAAIDQLYTMIEKEVDFLLSEDELQKSSRYLVPDDRKRYICARYLLRTLLPVFLQCDPATLEFMRSAKGKPHVTGIEFNIAHSGNYVLLAIGPTPLGIDIEYINKSFGYESILNVCFNPQEQHYISSAMNPAQRFYTLWTRKESILKASGEGLIEDMGSLDILNDQVLRHGASYHLKSFSIANDYIAALATDQQDTAINYWQY